MHYLGVRSAGTDTVLAFLAETLAQRRANLCLLEDGRFLASALVPAGNRGLPAGGPTECGPWCR